MSRRNTQQRRRQILDRIGEKGEVSVEDLAKRFSTSEVTIRKDLAALETDGLVLRRFGGAIPMPTDAPEVNNEKVSNRKIAIAKLAASLINDHDRIVIDSGSTTSALLPELNHKHGLVVMTNSLHLAQDLLELEREPTVLMTGGTWDTQSNSFQGAMAEQMLNAYNFDRAFVGAAGLDVDRGTTTFNELTQLTQAMAEVSRQVIVLAESSKFERKMPNIELTWDGISTLITDELIAPDIKAELEDQGVEVLCAEIAE
ncbi:DeoR/GlpR family DNA-binding transcription regulator [Alteromonas sp. a30]|uniref:DeoR/GlpR family DNA-binding transcription regulator n=1 Tax=Alteromonas sp. a30 TaxID=2730917 RepID=UPI00227DBBEF|nr:DeoR/GlpR family DNA-binding transcription regulator [Alteromonas sp. a30]MCY7294971.1 DeoR/GlpR transcriptional regulator [Alteromonas sp. a30]